MSEVIDDSDLKAEADRAADAVVKKFRDIAWQRDEIDRQLGLAQDELRRKDAVIWQLIKMLDRELER